MFFNGPSMCYYIWAIIHVQLYDIYIYIIKLPIYIITANRNSHKLHLLWDIYLQVWTSKSIHSSTISWRSGVFCSKKLEKRILYWYDIFTIILRIETLHLNQQKGYKLLIGKRKNIVSVKVQYFGEATTALYLHLNNQEKQNMNLCFKHLAIFYNWNIPHHLSITQ